MDKCLSIIGEQMTRTNDPAVLDVLMDMEFTVKESAKVKGSYVDQREFSNYENNKVLEQKLGNDYGYVEYASVGNQESVGIGTRINIRNGDVYWRVQGGEEKISKDNAQEAKNYMQAMRDNMGVKTISFAQAMAMQKGGRS